MIIRICIYSSLLILSACTYQNLDYEIGSSVSEMQDSQIYDRQNSMNPPSGVVAGVDGEAAENAINSYHKTESDASVSDTLIFQSGSQEGSK